MTLSCRTGWSADEAKAAAPADSSGRREVPRRTGGDVRCPGHRLGRASTQPCGPSRGAGNSQGSADPRRWCKGVDRTGECCPRKGNLYRARCRAIRAAKGARRVLVHNDRRDRTPGESPHSRSARSRPSSTSASCRGRKNSGQVNTAVPLSDISSSCRSSVEFSARLMAVKEWCPLNPVGLVN
jgi:hypothetical protein